MEVKNQFDKIWRFFTKIEEPVEFFWKIIHLDAQKIISQKCPRSDRISIQQLVTGIHTDQNLFLVVSKH